MPSPEQPKPSNMPRVPRFKDTNSLFEAENDPRLHRRIPSSLGRMTPDEIRTLQRMEEQEKPEQKNKKTPDAPPHTDNPQESKTTLTSGQLRIAKLVANGLSNSEIAMRLGIKSTTIGSQLPLIKDKLGLKGMPREEISLKMLEEFHKKN